MFFGGVGEMKIPKRTVLEHLGGRGTGFIEPQEGIKAPELEILMNGNINRGDFMRTGGTETFGIIDTFEHKYGIDSIPAIQLVNIHPKIGGNINKRYGTRIPEYGF